MILTRKLLANSKVNHEAYALHFSEGVVREWIVACQECFSNLVAGQVSDVLYYVLFKKMIECMLVVHDGDYI